MRRTILTAALGLALRSGVAWSACPQCVPLNDLSGPPHRGAPLGLYPGGSNVPPPAHQALAAAAAGAIVPRSTSGAPDPSGFIGLIAIGMSNANQEFARHERYEDARAGRNPRLVVVDAAVGGQSADVIQDPTAFYWTVVGDRVDAVGLDPLQVQIAWLKEADGAVPDTSFPAHADTLRSHLRSIVRNLKSLYPNLALCYLGSRIYGGYTTSPERGEPVSYETAFAHRGLIEEQISGDPSLNADPDQGPVQAPVLLWGPYLWANGATPRGSDGLTWNLSDLEADRLHPSPSGEAKVANLLSQFFSTDPTSLPWQAAGTGEASLALDAVADAYVNDAQPTQNYGGQTILAWQNPSSRSYLLFDLSSVADSVLFAKLSLLTPPDVQIQSADVLTVSDTNWSEDTINAANAPPIDGNLLGTIPMASRGTAASIDVTVAVRAAILNAPDSRLSLAVRSLTGAAPQQQVLSRESGDPPRLILSLVARTAAMVDGREKGALAVEVLSNPAVGHCLLRLRTNGSVEGVSLGVYDATGACVRTLAEGEIAGEERHLRWDGRDQRGRPCPSGVYFVRPSAGSQAGARFVFVRAR